MALRPRSAFSRRRWWSTTRFPKPPSTRRNNNTGRVAARASPNEGISMPANPVLWSLSESGVATVTLNRPEVNNAYDASLIHGLLSAMDELGKQKHLRVVVLKGNGKHFQAGADLKWINAGMPQSPDENEAVSKATFEAVQRLNRLPVPTVVLVQGGRFGGGTGVLFAGCSALVPHIAV